MPMDFEMNGISSWDFTPFMMAVSLEMSDEPFFAFLQLVSNALTLQSKKKKYEYASNSKSFILIDKW